MSTKRLHAGRRMSQAVVHGGIVYLAGQVAQNAAGQSVTEQTKDVLAIIDDLLSQAGTEKSRLLTAQIWLADITAFDEMNAVWDTWVSPDIHRRAPASRRSSHDRSSRSRSWSLQRYPEGATSSLRARSRGGAGATAFVRPRGARQRDQAAARERWRGPQLCHELGRGT
jgi:enamine deaminase RidA (YjgF/YER057c/UK114 family)